MATEWVVYSKPCITRTETVVDYLGRYSHRIALSDRRLLGFENGQVDLAYKDYRVLRPALSQGKRSELSGVRRREASRTDRGGLRFSICAG
jgi:hypothetical protein